MNLVSSLNPEQQQAVLQTDGALLILAGAGSGKTRVIAHRIAYLVSEGFADPSAVLAVTFTNKAAEEMRTRVEKLLEMDCRKMWISTFHALCARLLRREAPHVGLSRDFVIYDSNDQLSVVKQGLKELGIDDSATQPRMVLSRISHAKNRMEGPEVFEGSWNPRDQHIGKLYAMYTKALKDARALDFDDLLLYTVELVEKSETRPEEVRGAVPLHHGGRVPGHQPPAVPADPAAGVGPPQPRRGGRSRPVDLQVARRRPAEHPRLRARLSRSAGGAARAQLPLDAGDPRRGVRRHRPEQEPQGKAPLHRAGRRRAILYYRAGDDLDEAEYIARICRQALRDDGDNLAAVLYRTNAQSRTVEDALRRAGIPYRIIGGVRFYERKEVKDALRYLRLVLNPHDDVSLRRVINVPARGIGKGVMEALEAVEVARGRRPAAAARRPAAGGRAPRRYGRS